MKHHKMHYRSVFGIGMMVVFVAGTCSIAFELVVVQDNIEIVEEVVVGECKLQPV
jgi:hypothetical protein